MPSSACDWSSDVCSSDRSEEHTSELQSRSDLVCRLLLEKKKKHETTSSSRECLKETHIASRHSADAVRDSTTGRQTAQYSLIQCAHSQPPPRPCQPRGF